MEVSVNGIKLHYEVYGNGRPIILLGGNMKNTSYLSFMRKELEADYEVYVVDRRGSGKSTSDCELSYPETVKDLIEFIELLHIEKPFVLGHSGGGTVALLLAMNISEKLSGVIVCSGVARASLVKKPGYAAFMEKLPWYPGKASNERFEKLMKETPDITAEELGRITCPVFVVNGDKDPVVPVDEAKFIAESANGSLLLLPGENHASYMIKVKWSEKLKEFFNNAAS